MKKGISIWSFAGKTLRENLQLAKDAGFDGVELALNETGELSLESTMAEINGIREMVEEIGLEIYSLACGLYWTYNYTSADPQKRERAKAITRKQLEVAKALGCNTILVVPGAVEVAFDPGEVVPYDVAWNRALEALKELAPFAEEYQVAIGVENVWNRFLLSPMEMACFIDEIDSPYVGAYFDVGNVLNNGYPEHWIRILGKRIKKVHFKDYRRNSVGLDGFVDLLAGNVNWPEVMKAFSDIGYDDWCTAEMLPPYTHYPEAIVYNTSTSMDFILGRR